MATGYEDLIPVASTTGYEDLIPKVNAPTFGGMLQDELLRPFRAARDVVAGGVRGAGSVGATLLAPRDALESFIARQMGAPELQVPDRRAAMDAALKSMGADPESYAYGGGKLATEVAGTAGLGGFLARPVAAVAPYAPALFNPIVNALRSSGFSSGLLPKVVPGVAPQAIPLATRTADIGARVVGGGATGGATLALTNPDEIGTGVGLGVGTAMLGPSVGKSIEYLTPRVARAFGGAKDIFMLSGLKTSGLAAALNNDPALMAQAKTLLEQGRTIEEVAAILNSSGLATFAKTSRSASPATIDMYNARGAAREATQANQLAAASQNVNMLAQQNLPVATASPTAPRRAVKQALAGEAATLQGQKAAMTGQLTAEQQAAESALAEQTAARTSALSAEQQAAEASLAQRRADLHDTLPNIDPSESGAVLGQTKERLLKETQTKVTGPAYKKSFELAPDPFNIQSVVDKAKALGQDLLSLISPNTVPSELGRIQRVFQPPAPPTVAIGSGKISSRIKAPTPEIPPAMATLEDAATVNRALSAAYGKLESAPSSDTAATALRNNINAIRGELNAAIARGAPEEAVAAYTAAKQLHTNEVVQPFYTGKLSTTERSTRLGQPQLPAEKIVPTGLSSIQEAKAYVRTFSRDPESMQVLKSGILDQFRRDAVEVTGAGKKVSADKTAQWLDTHKEIIDVYDKAGMGLRADLERVASQAQELKVAAEGVKEATKAIPSKVAAEFAPAETALAAQGKAIPGKVAEAFKAEDEALNLASKTLGFGQTDKLRFAIVSSPETAGQALPSMDAPAKSSLARGVMQDAGKASDPLKYLADNEQGIMRVLRANDPKTAKATFDTAKNIAEITKLIEETGSKLGVKPQPNAMVTQQNLNQMTQGLPQVRAVVEDIQAQLAQGKTFEELAAQGAKSQTSALKLFREQTTPHMFPLNKVWSIANAMLGKLEGRIDAKLAVEIANELSTSATAAAAVGKAQARQAKQLVINEASKGAANVVRKIPPSAAVNFLAPAQQNQNAMAPQ
jgi:hypothetical protein